MSQPVELALATLGGDALGQIVRRHWLAMRPAFLTASIMPVVVGTAWGRVASGHVARTARIPSASSRIRVVRASSRTA